LVDTLLHQSTNAETSRPLGRNHHAFECLGVLSNSLGAFAHVKDSEISEFKPIALS
jgi:hypothetical protein